jgi:hypothetical protein
MIQPGERWLDTDGNPIQAHGGGILHHDGVYYWYGEHKDGPTKDQGVSRVDAIGISCYSSRNLHDWHFEGLALEAVPNDPEHELHPSKVLERPKVLHNPTTKKFVMFTHVDVDDYGLGGVGVAVSDRPEGPYTYLGSQQPCGFEGRDLTVFQEHDGTAYLFFASTKSEFAEHAPNQGRNHTLRVARLSPDYLHAEELVAELFSGTYREAPAVFKWNGTYHLITSGCTGWDTNPAQHASASSIKGEWTVHGNPCLGAGAETTFDSQRTFVLPVAAHLGAFVFMANRWNSKNLSDSRHVWLPIEIKHGQLEIRWHEAWSPEQHWHTNPSRESISSVQGITALSGCARDPFS